MKEMEDTDLVSRSFLTVFFLDVNNLKDALAGYRSIILRLKIKTSSDPKETLSHLNEGLKTAVIQWSDSVRHNVERCQISAEAIKEVMPELKIDDLKKYYEKIINQFSPEIEDVSLYTFEINKVFVKGTIEKIMNKMEKFYVEFKRE